MEMFINGMLCGAGFALAYFIGMGIYTLIVMPIWNAWQKKQIEKLLAE